MNSDARFRRTYALTTAVLVVLVAVFVGLSSFQGPKLSSAQVDRTGVDSTGGQQLRLFVNQAVATITAEQLSVVPAAEASVSTSGDVISVQFEKPLRYDTRYTVEVADVTSAYIDRPATLSYTFTTGSPAVYYLGRGSDSDSIVSTTITGTERDVLFSAPGIQDYAILDAVVAVSTEAGDGASELFLVNAAGDVESVALPGVGSIEKLAADSATGYLAFTFTSTDPLPSPAYLETLFTIDLNSGRLVEPVSALDGSLLSAANWDFVPGSSRIVVQDTDQGIFLVDAAQPGLLTPLGQFTELDSVSADGTTAVVVDPFGPLALTIADGTTTRMDPSAVDGVTPFGGTAQTLPGGAWIQQVAIPEAASGQFRIAVVYDNGSSSRVLYRTLNDQGSIEGFTISPNLQYVAIETVPNVADSVPDGYAVNGSSTTVTTVFVDISSGAVVKSVEGFHAGW